jgi:hypothetical protein
MFPGPVPIRLYSGGRGIDNLSTGKQENIAEVLNRIDIRETDLLDIEAMRRATSSKYSRVS